MLKINSFNKEKLANLILTAIGNDRSLNQYALHCDISSAHISRLSRGLLNTPPTPQILQKMADASQGRVTYSELMEACGYIVSSNEISIDDADIAFYNGVKGLNDTNKAILKGIIEGLTAKQKEEEKNTNDKK